MTTDYTINTRIQTLVAERAALEIQHNAECQANSKANQEFQKKASENQTRYAQITGGIAELQRLAEEQKKETNHDNLPTITDLNNRFADVCPSGKPEDR